MADSPYDSLKERRGAANVARRTRRRANTQDRRQDRRDDRPTPAPAAAQAKARKAANTARGGQLGKKAGRYRPGNNPYYTPQGGPGKGFRGAANYNAELDPEARIGRELAERGVAWMPNSPHPMDQIYASMVGDAAANFRALRTERPNVKIGRYANKLPGFDDLTWASATPVPAPGRGGRGRGRR